MQHVRVDHDPQRQLLQVLQLRHDIRLRIALIDVGAAFRRPTTRALVEHQRPSCCTQCLGTTARLLYCRR